MSQIRLPWVDPKLADAADINDPNLVDLNQAFRAWLVSAAFQRRLKTDLKAELHSLEQPALQHEQVWRLYRAHRLLTLLDHSPLEGELLDSYLHLLATGDGWYFTAQRAVPYQDDAERPTGILEIFARFLREAKPPTGELLIEDPAQLPFARVYQKDATYVPTTTEIHAPMASLEATAKFFRKNRTRLLRVTWSPHGKITSKIRRFVKDLHAHGIPVALEFAPVCDSPEPDEFIFQAMDELLRVEPYIHKLTLRTTRPELSDLLTVQLGAESNNKPRFAPHLTRRVAVASGSRLTAAKPRIVKSNFDLAAISIFSDPGKDAHPYRLGRGIPNAEAPSFGRQPKAGRFMLFAECARALPIGAEDAAYSEAVEFFQTRRRAAEFIRDYEPAQHTRVLSFLENLVNLEVLSLS